MAVVYEGEDLLLGRRVAVKVLREQFASDPGFLARFQREARAAASLSHPNVVAVYDVGSDAGTQYIVMELVHGRTLKEIIQAEAPIGAARIIELGRQICEALDYAHQHQIVHRDVKPHNILVTQDGRAKIADFGIAVALGASSLTQSGYVVGSAQYISPEQARGEASTAYSDLYSTGVVLYEMATGRLPFEGETSVVVALKQIQEEPVPPRRLNPRIPESLQAVILRTMAKEPSERFESGAAMGEALVACARASFEATQPQQAVAVRPQPSRAERAAGAVDVPRRETRQGRSGGWTVLVVVFAAFLCTLGSIPLGIVAYSSGVLGSLFPGLVAAPTMATPSPTGAPSPTATPMPTATAPPIRVPQLVGVPFSAARQQAQAHGLEVVIAGEEYSPQYPVAYVISQKPEADALVEKGTRIEVVVSIGREIVTVPKVVGMPATLAAERLQTSGLRWRIAAEWSDHVQEGVVISQNPAPEAQVDKGAEVFITVSKGRERVPVPDLVGRPEAEAQEMIVKAGLSKTWPNYQDYTFVPPGHVLSQEPKPGTMVEKGSTVYIAVRRPQPTEPPPVPTPTPRRRD